MNNLIAISKRDNQKIRRRKKSIQELIDFTENLSFGGTDDLGENLRSQWQGVWNLYKKLMHLEIDDHKCNMYQYDTPKQILIGGENAFRDNMTLLKIICQNANINQVAKSTIYIKWSQLISHLIDDIITDEISLTTIGYLYFDQYRKAFDKHLSNDIKSLQFLFQKDIYDYKFYYSYYPWGQLIHTIPALYDTIKTLSRCAREVNESISVPQTYDRQTILNKDMPIFKGKLNQHKILFASLIHRLLKTASIFDCPIQNHISQKYCLFQNKAKLKIIESKEQLNKFIWDITPYIIFCDLESNLPIIHQYLRSQITELHYNELDSFCTREFPYISDCIYKLLKDQNIVTAVFKDFITDPINQLTNSSDLKNVALKTLKDMKPNAEFNKKYSLFKTLDISTFLLKLDKIHILCNFVNTLIIGIDLNYDGGDKSYESHLNKFFCAILAINNVICLTPVKYESTNISNSKLIVNNLKQGSSKLKSYDFFGSLIVGLAQKLPQSKRDSRETWWTVMLEILIELHRRGLTSNQQFLHILKTVNLLIKYLTTDTFNDFPIELMLENFESYLDAELLKDQISLKETLDVQSLMVKCLNLYVVKLDEFASIKHLYLASSHFYNKLSTLLPKLNNSIFASDDKSETIDHYFTFLADFLSHLKGVHSKSGDIITHLRRNTESLSHHLWKLLLYPKSCYLKSWTYYRFVFNLIASDTFLPPPVTLLKELQMMENCEFPKNGVKRLKYKILNGTLSSYMSTITCGLPPKNGQYAVTSSVESSEKDVIKDSGSYHSCNDIAAKVKEMFAGCDQEGNVESIDRILTFLSKLVLKYSEADEIEHGYKINTDFGLVAHRFSYKYDLLKLYDSYDFRGVAKFWSPISTLNGSNNHQKPLNMLNREILDFIWINLPTQLSDYSDYKHLVHVAFVCAQSLYLCTKTLNQIFLYEFEQPWTINTTLSNAHTEKLGSILIKNIDVILEQFSNPKFHNADTFTAIHYEKLETLLSLLLNMVREAVKMGQQKSEPGVLIIYLTHLFQLLPIQGLRLLIAKHYTKRSSFCFHYRYLLSHSSTSCEIRNEFMYAQVDEWNISDQKENLLSTQDSNEDIINSQGIKYNKLGICLKLLHLATTLDMLHLLTRSLDFGGDQGDNILICIKNVSTCLDSQNTLSATPFNDNDRYQSWYFIKSLCNLVDDIFAFQSCLPRHLDIFGSELEFKVVCFDSIKLSIQHNLYTNSWKLHMLLQSFRKLLNYSFLSKNMLNKEDLRDTVLNEENNSEGEKRFSLIDIKEDIYLDMVFQILLTFKNIWNDYNEALGKNKGKSNNQSSIIGEGDFSCDDTETPKPKKANANVSALSTGCKMKNEALGKNKGKSINQSSIIGEGDFSCDNTETPKPIIANANVSALSTACKMEIINCVCDFLGYLKFDLDEFALKDPDSALTVLMQVLELAACDFEFIVRSHAVSRIQGLIQDYQTVVQLPMFFDSLVSAFIGDISCNTTTNTTHINNNKWTRAIHLQLLSSFIVVNRPLQCRAFITLLRYAYDRHIPFDLLNQFIHNVYLNSEYYVIENFKLTFLLPFVNDWIEGNKKLSELPFQYFAPLNIKYLFDHFYPTLLYALTENVNLYDRASLNSLTTQALDCILPYLDDTCLPTEELKQITFNLIDCFAQIRHRYWSMCDIKESNSTFINTDDIKFAFVTGVIAKNTDFFMRLLLKYLCLEWGDDQKLIASYLENHDLIRLIKIIKEVIYANPNSLLVNIRELLNTQPSVYYGRLLTFRDEVMGNYDNCSSAFKNSLLKYTLFCILVISCTSTQQGIIRRKISKNLISSCETLAASPQQTDFSPIQTWVLYYEEMSSAIIEFLENFLFLYSDGKHSKPTPSHVPDDIFQLLLQFLNLFTNENIEEFLKYSDENVIRYIRKFFISLNDVYFLLKAKLNHSKNSPKDAFSNDNHFSTFELRIGGQKASKTLTILQGNIDNLLTAIPSLTELPNIRSDDSMYLSSILQISGDDYGFSHLLKIKYLWPSFKEQKDNLNGVCHKDVIQGIGENILYIIAKFRKPDIRGFRNLAINVMAKLTPLFTTNNSSFLTSRSDWDVYKNMRSWKLAKLLVLSPFDYKATVSSYLKCIVDIISNMPPYSFNFPQLIKPLLLGCDENPTNIYQPSNSIPDHTELSHLLLLFHEKIKFFTNPQNIIKSVNYLNEAFFELCQHCFGIFASDRQLIVPYISKSIKLCCLLFSHVLMNLFDMNPEAYFKALSAILETLSQIVTSNPLNKFDVNLDNICVCFIDAFQSFVSRNCVVNCLQIITIPFDFSLFEATNISSKLAYMCNRHHTVIYLVEYLLTHLILTRPGGEELGNKQELLKLYVDSYMHFNLTGPLYAYVASFPDSFEDKINLNRLQGAWDKCFINYEIFLKQSSDVNKINSIATQYRRGLRNSSYLHLNHALTQSNEEIIERELIQDVTSLLSRWDLDCQSNQWSSDRDACACSNILDLNLYNDGFDRGLKHCMTLFLNNQFVHFKNAKTLFINHTAQNLTDVLNRWENNVRVDPMLCGISFLQELDDIYTSLEEGVDQRGNDLEKNSHLLLDEKFQSSVLYTDVVKGFSSIFHLVVNKMVSPVLNSDIKASMMQYFQKLHKLCLDTSLKFSEYSIAHEIVNCINLIYSSHTSIFLLNFEKGRLAWKMGEKKLGIATLQKAIKEMQWKLSNSEFNEFDIERNEFKFIKDLLSHALVMCGDWLSESCSELPAKIYDCYYKKAIDILSTARINSSLARFADQQYQRICKHLKSDIYERKCQLAREYAAQIEEMRKVGIAPNRYLMTVQKQGASDLEEIERLKQQRQEYLLRCLSCYLECLALSDAYDAKVFRIVSLWFENSDNEQVNALVASKHSFVPTKKWLPLITQIIARLSIPIEDLTGGNTKQSQLNSSFSKTLFDLVLSIGLAAPLELLHPLLALKHAHMDELYDKSRNLSPSNHKIVKSDKTMAAIAILTKMVEKRPDIEKMLKNTQHLCTALVDFAYYKVPENIKKDFATATPSDSPKSTPIPSSTSIALWLKNVEALEGSIYLPIFRANPSASRIINIAPTFQLAGGINLPKILTCTSEDGIKRRILLKGQDDLRQDAVMQQIFNLVNNLLSSDLDKSTTTPSEGISINRGRNYACLDLETYGVIPLSQKSGIIEWCEGTIPLGQYLVGHPRDESKGAHHRFGSISSQSQYTAMQCRKLLSEATDDDKVEVFLKICDKFGPVFRYFFFESYPNPMEWFRCRMNYVNSVATSSMVGYILGLGDRHVHNILIRKDTGKVVHIDLGVAFEQGKLLPTPETVPFRLTRDIVDGMGYFGVEGTFRKNCEGVMQTLRQSCKSLLTVAQVLLHDPLYSWSLSPRQMMLIQNKGDGRDGDQDEATFCDAPCNDPDEFLGKSKRRGIGKPPVKRAKTKAQKNKNNLLPGPKEANKLAERVLLRMEQKLLGMEEGHVFKVEDQVSHLINEAREAQNLARLFPGWQPYI